MSGTGDFKDLSQRLEEYTKSFADAKLLTFLEDAYYYSESVQDINLRSVDMYVDYLVNECTSLNYKSAFSFVSNPESCCRQSLSSYERSFQNEYMSKDEQKIYGHHQDAEKTVLYGKRNTKSYAVTNPELRITLIIDFPFNYEIRNNKRKIHDRFVSIELLVCDDRLLISHFPRNQIGRVLYFIKQFITIDFSSLEKGLIDIKTKYETEQKLIEINRQACLQFTKLLSKKTNFTFETEDCNYFCNMKVILPKKMNLSIQVNYIDFLNRQKEIEDLLLEIKQLLIEEETCQ